jgi:hypothetical protein
MPKGGIVGDGGTNVGIHRGSLSVGEDEFVLKLRVVGVGSTEEELNQGSERRPSAGEAFGRQNGVWPEYVSSNIEKQLRDCPHDKS